VRFGRHGKDDGWGSLPSRSAERDAHVTGDDPDPARRPPGRKDRWASCKAAKGGPHLPVIVYRAPVFRADLGCRWHPMWDHAADRFTPGWLCHHQEQCAGCGKVFRASIPRWECPGWEAAQVFAADAEAEADAATARHRARPPRRPPVTGPQGYRRRRGER
jgi:hypothetical protein